MNKSTRSFIGFTDSLGFIAHSVQIYGVSGGELSESVLGNRFLALFSREFLRQRGWAVFPLWEGDLRILKKKNGEKIELLNRVRDFCSKNNEKSMYIAALQQEEWPYSGDFSAVTVAINDVDVDSDGLNKIFEVSPGNLPHWGHNFIWSSGRRFMIYSDGDNVSFIAGNYAELEGILGVSFEYCMERFVAANMAHGTEADLIEVYVQFCEEFRVWEK